jgi:ATP-dependent Lon protease
MSTLDNKINEHFAGLVVRKDLVKTVKGNAIVPSYVLEYLLGQYCATNDEDSINTGIQTVKEILAKHYVHRNEAGLIRSTIKEKGRHKVIDKISVSLNDKDDTYEAEFSNLGIKKVLVDSSTVKAHPKLLVSGVWCIADLEYDFNEEDKKRVPWVLSALKPIQLSHFDYSNYIQSREKFNVAEWLDVIIQSVGFNPEMISHRNKLMQLVRLIPFCERNYNLVELGPKGTGKSHIYSEFSPHGILISGGEVTVPKLFVNNSSGKIGLVGYWDCVAFDEFAGKKKKIDKALVDIMKNYMANKSFSRGVETLGAEASMVFIGNTSHVVPYMLKHADLFMDLPDSYHDSAFLDRLHFYIPGWEADIIRGEMFSEGYGFVVDYIAEVFKYLRNQDYSDRYQQYFTLSKDISTRDRDGIHKTFSGLMKILYPSGEATKDEIEEILHFAIEGRKRVKDQLLRIDSTYAATDFSYQVNGGEWKRVHTLEEKEYPKYYYARQKNDGGKPTEASEETSSAAPADTERSIYELAKEIHTPKEKHLEFMENQKGVTYDMLFGEYIKGAKNIIITDSYLRIFFQLRNLMEFVECAIRHKDEEEALHVHVITGKEDRNLDGKQDEAMEQIQEAAALAGVEFTWEYDTTNTLHARHIVVDDRWKISLDRGLDIFQNYEMNNAFGLSNRLQQYRGCKKFEVTYIKMI